MTILGIDLGTTNSACAIWKDGKPLLIPNRLGEYLTPSVVGLDNDGELLVGEVARQRLLTHPDKTASVFKRYMGTDHLLRLGKKNYSAIELSSLVLKHLKEDAEAYLKTSLLEAIISVPAYFNDLQRKATKAAAELAGLKVERLINEPTAAAMVYGLHEQSDGAQFIILDLGGGTFDVSLVEYFEGVLEVHASSGDNHLGGEDFLKVLEIDFLEKNQLKPEKLTAKNRNSLLFALESAKQALSTQHEVTLEHVIPDQKEPWLMTRKSFETLSLPLLSRIQMPIQQALRDAQVSPQEISEVILVGGSTRLTSVRTLISRLFKRLPLSTLDPDLVIAMGAGIQAGLKEKQSDLADVVLTDVSPYSLGLEVTNKNDESDKQGGLFSPIIERNSTVPISIEKPFHTIQDNQTELELNIFQGESRLVRNNIFLGSLNVNIPKAKAGVEAIDVRFSYDMNGLLEVDTTVRSTGQTFNKTIVNTQESLSETALAASRIKLAKLKFHPRDHEKNRLLLARADKIFESSLSERREYISSLTNEFDAVLQRQQPTEITRAAKEFTKYSMNWNMREASNAMLEDSGITFKFRYKVHQETVCSKIKNH